MASIERYALYDKTDPSLERSEFWCWKQAFLGAFLCRNVHENSRIKDKRLSVKKRNSMKTHSKAQKSKRSHETFISKRSTVKISSVFG